MNYADLLPITRSIDKIAARLERHEDTETTRFVLEIELRALTEVHDMLERNIKGKL